METDTDIFIQRLPKAEVHLHLEGAIPWDLVRARASEPLPATPAWTHSDHRFANWAEFSEAIRLPLRTVLHAIEDYRQTAQRIFDSLQQQNVRYVEISFGPDIVVEKGLRPADVAAAIKSVAPASMSVCVFCGLHRRMPPGPGDAMVDDIFGCSDIDGLDLHGSETSGRALPFADIFQQARDRGLMTKAHCGETVGPASIRETIDALHVQRLQHGVTACRDEALMQRIQAERITLDVCPTSNLKLGVVADIARHPIRDFHERGIRVTVNTDDPTVFGCTLSSELRLLVDRLDFSLRDLAALQVNAFEAAKMPDDRRAAILAEISALTASL